MIDNAAYVCLDIGVSILIHLNPNFFLMMRICNVLTQLKLSFCSTYKNYPAGHMVMRNSVLIIMLCISYATAIFAHQERELGYITSIPYHI